MTHPVLAIICDDLSSATDCGVQVARWKLGVTVPLTAPELWSALPSAEVMSVSTESRALSGASARALTRRAATHLWDMGYRHFYKSMDSTMRGNVLEEVRALIAVADPPVVVVAPAFPTYGRTTQGGVQLLNGIPIHETEFGSDPTAPVRVSSIAELLAPLDLKQSLFSVEEVRQPTDALSSRMRQSAGDGNRVLVFDILEEADLARLVRAVGGAQMSALWVGSTGLAGHVGSYFRPEPPPETTVLPEHLAPGLVIAGTASEHTRRQFALLAQRADVAVVKVDPRQLVFSRRAALRELERCRSLAVGALRTGQTAAVGFLSDREEVADVTRLGTQGDVAPAEVSRRLTQALARLARDIAEQAPSLSGLVLTGGETASAICAEFGAEAIHIIREVEPGIPLTRLAGPRPILAVIKAGAFGSPHALLAAFKHLTLESTP